MHSRLTMICALALTDAANALAVQLDPEGGAGTFGRALLCPEPNQPPAAATHSFANWLVPDAHVVQWQAFQEAHAEEFTIYSGSHVLAINDAGLYFPAEEV